MDLEEIRWKLADELQPEEKAFLNEHRAELDDAEQNAFKDFLEQDPATTPAPVENEPDQNAAPAAENPPIDEPITFKSAAERDAWLADEITKKEAEKAAATPAKEEAPVDTKSPFDIATESLKGKKYEDASEAYADFVKALAVQAKLENEAQQKVNEKFEMEYKNLVLEKKLPDPDTDEGKKFKNELIQFGVKHGKQTYHDAHELWSQVPEQFGGGFKAEDQKKKEVDNKAQIDKQKKAASLLGSGNQAKAPDKKGIGLTWEQLHNTDIDNLVDV